MKKKYLALLLSAAMVFSSLPTTSANAAPVNEEPTTETGETIIEEISEESTIESSMSETTENNQEPETIVETTEATIMEEASASDEVSTTEYTEDVTAVEEIPETEILTEEDLSIDSSDLCITEAETSIKAVGSNGVTYDNVAYLSSAAVQTFSAATQNAYTTMCDTIAAWKENGWNVSDIAIFINENGDLELSASFPVQSQSYTIHEEDISGIPYVELNTLLQNEEAFRSQLSSEFEQLLYDAGKESIVVNGKNYIYLEMSASSDLYEGWEAPCNVFSALSAAYPNKFNWVNWADASYKRQIYYYEQSNSWGYKYTLNKSKYYSSSLEKKAAAKVNTLVEEANAYAKEYYNESPAYGIIKYFNEWLSENNFYEREHGTSTEESVKNGKIYYYSHSCYGTLLYGYGTPDGYALTMSRLLDAAGIRNMYVTGELCEDDSPTEYAWNYVQMPDGYWYLIDPIRNDTENCDSYLLITPCDTYESDSRKWKKLGDTEIGKKIDYESLITPASSDYIPETSESQQLQTLSLDKEILVLKPGQTYTLSLTDSNTESNNYYEKFTKTWKSEDTSIAKISQNGKITAGTVPGETTVTLECANQTLKCTVYVYQFTNIKFDTNNKTSYTVSYANPDKYFNESDLQTIELTVNQKNPQITAQDIVYGNNLNEVTAVSNKPSIAKVDSVTLEDDTIILNVLPKAVGSAKITITLAGKKAYYTIKITQDLQEDWFDYSNVVTTEYSGKAIKPAIPLTEEGRDCSPRATYKITYSNNKNSGKATITIKGTGKYSGTLTKTFSITPKKMFSTEFRSCTSSKTYNAKPLAVSTTVKSGKTTLKAGRDYDVYYNNSTTVPTDAGTYTIKIVGKGNYTGTSTVKKEYTIKPATIKKVTVTCKSTVKYTGDTVYPTFSVKISGKKLPEENYTVTYLDSTGTQITKPIEKGKYTLVITPTGENVKPTLTKSCIKKNFTIR